MTVAPRPARVTVLASRVRTEEKLIFDALDARAAAWERIDVRTLWRTADARTPAWQVALNREIGQTRAVHVARTLESAGVTVLNSAAATEVCGDKWRTTLALREAGVPHPRSALALTPQAALEALDDVGYPAVVKPLTGSWGRLVAFLPDAGVAATVLEFVAALPSPHQHLVYVQEFIGTPGGPGRDLRAVVIGGELLGVTERVGEGWRSNVHRGARSTLVQAGPELGKLAIGASAAVDADIAGVDLTEDGDGQLLVLEVNHGVEFASFQAAAGDTADVAGRIADLLLAEAERCCG